MLKIGLVFLGGGIGSVLRYGITKWMGTLVQSAFPWGTLAVNIAGSLLIGLVYARMEGRPGFENYSKYFIVTGILGGFTTFSAFSYDALLLMKNNLFLPALAYIGGSVLVCIAGAAAGYYLFRQ